MELAPLLAYPVFGDLGIFAGELNMIEVIVKTNAKRNSISKTGENSYKIETKTRAKDMEANLKVIEILAEYLKIPKNSLFIKSGLRYKKKLIEIR